MQYPYIRIHMIVNLRLAFVSGNMDRNSFCHENAFSQISQQTHRPTASMD